jgi:homoserine kinase
VPDRMHVSAPASAANLGPGFDCLAVALELRNEVAIGPAASGEIEVDVQGEGVRAASRGADNLFVRAFAATGADPAGLRFEMRNRIPFYRGLGSSATRCPPPSSWKGIPTTSPRRSSAG